MTPCYPPDSDQFTTTNSTINPDAEETVVSDGGKI
jgi:hypothetical protein